MFIVDWLTEFFSKEPMYIAGQLVGILVAIFAILSLQCKNIKGLLALQVLANGLLMLNYALLDNWSGAVVGILAAVQTVIIFLFRSKEKDIPLYITILFMASFIVSTVFTYQKPLDILPCVAALVFVLITIQKKTSVCRKYALLNNILWIIYDIGAGAWTTLITHILLLISAIVGIIRLDIKKDKQ